VSVYSDWSSVLNHATRHKVLSICSEQLTGQYFIDKCFASTQYQPCWTLFRVTDIDFHACNLKAVECVILYVSAPSSHCIVPRQRVQGKSKKLGVKVIFVRVRVYCMSEKMSLLK